MRLQRSVTLVPALNSSPPLGDVTVSVGVTIVMFAALIASTTGLVARTRSRACVVSVAGTVHRYYRRSRFAGDAFPRAARVVQFLFEQQRRRQIRARPVTVTVLPAPSVPAGAVSVSAGCRIVVSCGIGQRGNPRGDHAQRGIRRARPAHGPRPLIRRDSRRQRFPRSAGIAAAEVQDPRPRPRPRASTTVSPSAPLTSLARHRRKASARPSPAADCKSSVSPAAGIATEITRSRARRRGGRRRRPHQRIAAGAAQRLPRAGGVGAVQVHAHVARQPAHARPADRIRRGQSQNCPPPAASSTSGPAARIAKFAADWSIDRCVCASLHLHAAGVPAGAVTVQASVSRLMLLASVSQLPPG